MRIGGEESYSAAEVAFGGERREKGGESCILGLHKKNTLPKKGSSNSEVFPVKPAGQQCPWGGGQRPGSGQHGVRISWGVPLVENVPLPRGFLEEGILPLQEQKTWQAPLSGHSSAKGRSAGRGRLTWSLLFAVLHHKLQAPVHPYNYFSGTKWYQTQHCEAVLWRTGANLHRARSFKVWSFQSGLRARGKTKENCDSGCVDSLGTDRVRTGI